MFSQTPALSAPSAPFIILSRVESTNNYAMAKLHAGVLRNGTTFLAYDQTSGKGQRGKSWNANPGENITLTSAYSLPDSFSATAFGTLQSFPFLFSVAVAFGCYDFIKASGVTDVKIKWPNDLYIRDRKAGGILIENIYRNNSWAWTIAGVGINLNQAVFPGLEKKATSISLATGCSFNLYKSARQLDSSIKNRLNWVDAVTPQEVMLSYNSVLYLAGEEVRLKKDSATFSTTISHVDVSGNLHTEDVMSREFRVGEVEFVTV